MALSWATRRKLIYSILFLIIILLVIAWPAYHFLYKPPTCFDGIQNQGELGIDCGGPCQKLCASQAQAPIILWQRVFKEAPGLYNAVAYIENPNLNSEASGLSYDFRVYDASDILISERTGKADILPNKNIAIFESALSTGSKDAKWSSFQFTSVPDWKLISGVAPHVSVVSTALSRETSRPKLTVVISNDQVKEVMNVPVVAIMYDVNGNAIEASRTMVDDLLKGQSTTIYFTWPSPFSAQVSQKEIIPLVGQ
jgi:hypothetical protein